MRCASHIFVERKGLGSGTWDLCSIDELSYDQMLPRMLAGIPMRPPSGIPFYDAKGLPPYLSKELRWRYDNWSLAAYGATWLSLDELIRITQELAHVQKHDAGLIQIAIRMSALEQELSEDHSRLVAWFDSRR